MWFFIYMVCAMMIFAGVSLLRGRQNLFPRLPMRRGIRFGRFTGNKTAAYFRDIKLGEWLKKRKEDRIDKEIYESVSFLRNIIALGNGRRVSADYIIEQLSHREGMLQRVYIKMLRLLRVGNVKEAVKVFAQGAFTQIGAEFGDLLLKWDSMDPIELTEILISYQKSIKEVKATAQRKKDEIVSEFIYLPVVLNVFIIFINFIVVGYFMEQRQMLNMLF